MIKYLKEKIVTQRKDLRKKDMQHNNTKILDEIISIHKQYYDRSGLGYKKTEKVLISKTIYQRSYVETIICSRNKEEGKKIQ
jgi:hypothetical protein